MARLRPGWFVVVFAALLAGSAWLPWLTTVAQGGGRASAIGGTHGSLVLPRGFGAGQLIVVLSSVLLVAGAMVGRGLSVRWASIAALIVSVLIIGITVWYYRLNVGPRVSAEYGLYVGVGGAACAAVCASAAVIAALASKR